MMAARAAGAISAAAALGRAKRALPLINPFHLRAALLADDFVARRNGLQSLETMSADLAAVFIQRHIATSIRAGYTCRTFYYT